VTGGTPLTSSRPPHPGAARSSGSSPIGDSDSSAFPGPGRFPSGSLGGRGLPGPDGPGLRAAPDGSGSPGGGPGVGGLGLSGGPGGGGFPGPGFDHGVGGFPGLGQAVYPGLGFDPAPGDPVAVEDLGRRLAGAAAWLGDARTLVERLATADGPEWQGQAATAFRGHLRDGLIQHLGVAHDALRQAADRLQDWQADLLGHQRQARRLDEELQQVRASPMPSAGRGADLEATTEAVARVQQEVDRLLAEAGELEQVHTADAARTAAALRADWAGTGPQGAGEFGELLARVRDGVAGLGAWLYRHVGTISAVSGFLALYPSPLTPLLAGIAVVGGAVQLGKDIDDPGLWAALWPPRPGLDSAVAAVTLGGDVAGVVPGITAVARGASGTVKGLRAASAGGRAVPVEAAAGSFLRNTVTVLSREARGEAAVRLKPGMTAADIAARRRHIRIGRGVAAVGVGAAVDDELTSGPGTG